MNYKALIGFNNKEELTGIFDKQTINDVLDVLEQGTYKFITIKNTMGVLYTINTSELSYILTMENEEDEEV